jgi:hypothetical protein
MKIMIIPVLITLAILGIEAQTVSATAEKAAKGIIDLITPIKVKFCAEGTIFSRSIRSGSGKYCTGKIGGPGVGLVGAALAQYFCWHIKGKDYDYISSEKKPEGSHCYQNVQTIYDWINLDKRVFTIIAEAVDSRKGTEICKLVENTTDKSTGEKCKQRLGELGIPWIE